MPARQRHRGSVRARSILLYATHRVRRWAHGRSRGSRSSLPQTASGVSRHRQMAMIGNLRPASDAQIARLLANPEEITRFLYGSDVPSNDRVVLNKAWHAIHFVLTGSRLGGSAPLNFLVDEGTPVGAVDVGYGPARVLTSDQVRQLADALAAIR